MIRFTFSGGYRLIGILVIALVFLIALSIDGAIVTADEYGPRPSDPPSPTPVPINPPGDPPVFSTPEPGAESSPELITPVDGGIASSEDGDVLVEILPSSVTDWQGLTVKKLDLVSLPPPDGTFRFGSKAFEVTFTDADGNPIERFQLDRPAVIKINYTETDALSVYNLAIFRYDARSNVWVRLNTSVDPVARILTARVAFFSKFVIGIPILAGEPVPTEIPVLPVPATATPVPDVIPTSTPIPAATLVPATATQVPAVSPTSTPAPTETAAPATATSVPVVSPTLTPAPTETAAPATSVPATSTVETVVSPTSLPPATPSPTPIPVPVEPEEDDGFSVVWVIVLVLAAIALIAVVYFSPKKRKR